MKAYGKSREDCANRNRKGTSRPCPCCIPGAARRKRGIYRGRARAQGKKEAEQN